MQFDHEIFELIREEFQRQQHGLELIASENFSRELKRLAKKHSSDGARFYLVPTIKRLPAYIMAIPIIAK